MTDMAIGRSKKEIRKTIQEKLSITLADYRSVIGEKRFENRVKKAARLFGADILKSLPKKQKKEKKTSEEEAS